MALNKKNRLKKKQDFEKVFKKGRAVRGNFLFIRYLKNSADRARIAFIVSSKVSKSAVVRNRIRRILSEAVRPRIENIGSLDVAVIADKKILDASGEEISYELKNMIDKIK